MLRLRLECDAGVEKVFVARKYIFHLSIDKLGIRHVYEGEWNLHGEVGVECCY